METILDKLEWLFAALGAALGWFFGGLDGFLYALIALTMMDYLTGILKAVVHGTLSSLIGLKGIARKITIFVLVGVSHVVDAQLFGHGEVLRDMVIFFYLANEGISIMENAVEIGIPVPDFLKEKLAQIRDKDKSGVQNKSKRAGKESEHSQDFLSKD